MLNHYGVRCVWFCWLCVVLIATVQAQATDTLAQDEDTLRSPHFRVLSEGISVDTLPLLLTAVDVNISGFVADVTVTQFYKNDGDLTLEAEYVFPGSEKGAVYGMTMTVGERVIEAKVKTKSEARADYEVAVEEGKTASLLEQEQSSYFRTSVGNIRPGDDIRVELRYTETLIPDEGLYSFRFPLVRQTPPDQTHPLADSVPLEFRDRSSFGFDITAQINAGMPVASVESPSHNVDVTLYPNQVEVLLGEGAYLDNDRDFVLNYRLAGDQIQSGLMLYQGEEENFFLLMAQPPEHVAANEIPPRDYRFVVDASGSMNGFPFNLARDITEKLLTQLRPEDYFNVHLFASASTSLSDTVMQANAASIDSAVDFLAVSSAGGATNLLPVLEQIATEPLVPGRSRSVIVITDGAINVSQETLTFIQHHLNEMNVFVYGTGAYQNNPAVQAIARAGQGQAFSVQNANESSDKVSEKFLSYVAQTVLTQLELEYPPEFEAYDVQPFAIPDVFAQRPVFVVGKWRGRPAGNMILRGYTADQPYAARFPIHAADSGAHNAGIRLLWAREHLTALEDLERVLYAPQWEEAITEIGLKYNLLTQYTSFVAVDNVVRSEFAAGESQDLLLRRKVTVTGARVSTGFGFASNPIAVNIPALSKPAADLPERIEQRSTLPLPSDPHRPSVTFILGQDEDSTNPFYKNATRYFYAQAQGQARHQLVTSARDLSQVKRWLQRNAPANEPWGVVNVVTHATPWTGLGSALMGSGPGASAAASPLHFSHELALSDALSDTVVDRSTQLRIYGCGLGALPQLLGRIGQFFGGRDEQRPMVVSPQTPVVFQVQPGTRSNPQAQMALWNQWWVLSPAREALSQERFIQRLQARYGEQDWQRFFPVDQSQGVEVSPEPALATVHYLPVEVRMAFIDGLHRHSRFSARQLVAKQPELLAYLAASGFDAADLRWEISSEGEYGSLVGRGVLHQVIAAPTTDQTQTPSYTLVRH